jgi:hypothetical protein
MGSVETPRNTEAERPRETLFPLDPQLLDERMRLFEHSSEAFLRLVTEARGKWGAASSLYANMPFVDLLEWHGEKQDFALTSELYYRAGLLYGMDVTKMTRLGRDPMAHKLEADHPEAFAHALEYMEETYRGLDDEYGFDRRQQERELRYTGSNVLADATLRQYLRLARQLDTVLTEDTLEDIAALHVGMVDGAIFVNAYNAFTHGVTPRTF